MSSGDYTIDMVVDFENTISRLEAEKAVLLAACRIAEQLANLAGDWHLDEIEIDGEMRNIYDVRDIFADAIDKAKGEPDE